MWARLRSDFAGSANNVMFLYRLVVNNGIQLQMRCCHVRRTNQRYKSNANAATRLGYFEGD